ncbi:MAG: hypothetical protein ETSY2_22710 [Candidatus Entotheonella gemina]|uniref:Uncharacterized protein n=1 Tax=Candidatus Entotheonella gemina TaxID=1429439 RepID=W4M5K3_9BACT|nr:MAG: hypothetical protein ETSY2_22710 [Candidatus Entotheonella gemina]
MDLKYDTIILNFLAQFFDPILWHFPIIRQS